MSASWRPAWLWFAPRLNTTSLARGEAPVSSTTMHWCAITTPLCRACSDTSILKVRVYSRHENFQFSNCSFIFFVALNIHSVWFIMTPVGAVFIPFSVFSWKFIFMPSRNSTNNSGEDQPLNECAQGSSYAGWGSPALTLAKNKKTKVGKTKTKQKVFFVYFFFHHEKSKKFF